MSAAVDYIKSELVSKFSDTFLEFASEITRQGDLSKLAVPLRGAFFDYFKTDTFLEIYEQFAGQLSAEYSAADQELLFQKSPTPRVFTPGSHGTNWHCDYWYGHGQQSKTVWVPIANAIPGSTFNAVKSAEDNAELYKKYSEKPELLTQEFDLMGAETVQVCPNQDSAAVFATNVLHGSTNNTTNQTRLSFDFRFSTRDDPTSTKNLSEYLTFSNGRLFASNDARKDIRFLKYICGGRGMDTKSQHLLIEASCKDAGLSVVGQEAEIERFAYPMLKYHIGEIGNSTSRYSGIVMVSKKLVDDADVMAQLSRSKIPVFFSLEQEWL